MIKTGSRCRRRTFATTQTEGRLWNALERIDQEIVNWPVGHDAPYSFLLGLQDLALRAQKGETVDPYVVER